MTETDSDISTSSPVQPTHSSWIFFLPYVLISFVEMNMSLSSFFSLKHFEHLTSRAALLSVTSGFFFFVSLWLTQQLDDDKESWQADVA